MQLNNQAQQAVSSSASRDMINNLSDAELRSWADRFNVTKVQVKAATNAVGSSAKAVEAYLNRKKL